ncbi:hypothetical protein [Nocardia otitidiscaviarum]|uniref:hypothetical protein n=1 Tax=Nocardia otitidiscaviarum TaxID=1823 RepID=UPI0018933A27|nr:hypothetical protein [Nocardia otitidiscaviarum]MBF6182086.1 hypothetical protein [Nocardia otitidiscaviarum]
MVTNPAAKEVFGDSWATVAGGLALSFRTMAAGMVPQEHEIISCGQDFPAQGWKMTVFVRSED